jgi:hypothetical protein
VFLGPRRGRREHSARAHGSGDGRHRRGGAGRVPSSGRRLCLPGARAGSRGRGQRDHAHGNGERRDRLRRGRAPAGRSGMRAHRCAHRQLRCRRLDDGRRGRWRRRGAQSDHRPCSDAGDHGRRRPGRRSPDRCCRRGPSERRSRGRCPRGRRGRRRSAGRRPRQPSRRRQPRRRPRKRPRGLRHQTGRPRRSRGVWAGRPGRRTRRVRGIESVIAGKGDDLLRGDGGGNASTADRETTS